MVWLRSQRDRSRFAGELVVRPPLPRAASVGVRRTSGLAVPSARAAACALVLLIHAIVLFAFAFSLTGPIPPIEARKILELIAIEDERAPPPVLPPPSEPAQTAIKAAAAPLAGTPPAAPARPLLFSNGVLAPYAGSFDRPDTSTALEYHIAMGDEDVIEGAALTVYSALLKEGDSFAFDGSAETNGSFRLIGGKAVDRFIGGAGPDVIEGGGAADLLEGGGGADLFLYRSPEDSSGPAYDTIVGFDPSEDKIVLPVPVGCYAGLFRGGTLSPGSFDEDLKAALGQDRLPLGAFSGFLPSQGTLAGTPFLVVEANGAAGYQPGEDYVFRFTRIASADFPTSAMFAHDAGARSAAHAGCGSNRAVPTLWPDPDRISQSEDRIYFDEQPSR